MMKKTLFITLLIICNLTLSEARNPKYEKMLKHIVRHQKEYVGMDAGAFYQKIQEDGFPIRWVNLDDGFRCNRREISGISLFSETRLQIAGKKEFYTVLITFEENTMLAEGFCLDIPRDPFPLEMPDNDPFVKGVLEKTKSFKVKSIKCTFGFSEPLEGMKKPKKKKEKKKIMINGLEFIPLYEPGH